MHPHSLISTFDVHYLDSKYFHYLDSKYNTYTCYSRNLKTLASLCSWADRFESYMVGNPEDRFSWCGSYYAV